MNTDEVPIPEERQSPQNMGLFSPLPSPHTRTPRFSHRHLQIAFLFVTQNCKLSISLKPGVTQQSGCSGSVITASSSVRAAQHISPLVLLSSRTGLSPRLWVLLLGDIQNHEESYSQTSAARQSSRGGAITPAYLFIC